MTRTPLFLLLVGILPGFSQAEGPLVGDRPDFTESAVAVPTGSLQFELGMTRYVAGEAKSTHVGEVLLRIGVARDTELRLIFGSYVHATDPADPRRDIDGFNDIGLGFKYRLVANDGWTPDLALLGTVTFPTGATHIGAEAVQPLGVVAAGWALPANLSLGANLGTALLNVDSVTFGTSWLSTSLALALGERWGLFAEAFGFDREEKNGDSTGYADFGVTFQPQPTWQLDARVGRGFSDEDEDWFAGAGVVIRI
jgi:hypothetical protein